MAAQTGNALIAGVIGDPIAHSLSPAIHEAWLDALGMDGAYIPLRITSEHLREDIRHLQRLGFRGFNVTLPHKEAVHALCDWHDPAAQATGAINTLVFSGRDIHGYNTDVSGFCAHLGQSVAQASLDLSHCLVLGAGGAARGVAYGLAQMGATHITLCNRTQATAEAVAAAISAVCGEQTAVHTLVWEHKEQALPQVTLLVNTTQLGMKGQPPLSLPLETLPAHAVVADIVYQPLVTPLLAEARKRGLVTVDGLGMLLHQAAPGFTMWFGATPQVTPELRAYIESLLPCRS